MRVSCCCCALCLFAGVLLRGVACVAGLRRVWGVVVGFAFLGRTDVRTDACVGRMSEQKRSLWAATGLSAGPLTRVLGACLCVCPQEPGGWPGCGYMRRWVSLDLCFACAWRVGVCVCVCGWACFVVRAGCSLRFLVARVCGIYVAPGIFLRLKVGTRARACCVWAVVCPSPLPSTTAALPPPPAVRLRRPGRGGEKRGEGKARIVA